MHAYVRRVWTEGDDDPGNPYNWDSDGRLYACLVLSRLVRDNHTSCEHAVRRLVRADGGESLVPFSAFDSHVAYRLHPDRPGWLDVEEARQLQRLLQAFLETQPPLRVTSAVRRAESATRERFLEDALPLAVGGAEALLKVGRDYARAQFVQRTAALASDVGTNLAEGQCDDLYRDRSALVHGGQVDLSEPHTQTSFEVGFVALQETLRAGVRRAIEDREFAEIFERDDRIAARWPVIVRRGDNTITL